MRFWEAVEREIKGCAGICRGLEVGGEVLKNVYLGGGERERDLNLKWILFGSFFFGFWY